MTHSVQANPTRQGPDRRRIDPRTQTDPHCRTRRPDKVRALRRRHLGSARPMLPHRWSRGGLHIVPYRTLSAGTQLILLRRPDQHPIESGRDSNTSSRSRRAVPASQNVHLSCRVSVRPANVGMTGGRHQKMPWRSRRQARDRTDCQRQGVVTEGHLDVALRLPIVLSCHCFTSFGRQWLLNHDSCALYHNGPFFDHPPSIGSGRHAAPWPRGIHLQSRVRRCPRAVPAEQLCTSPLPSGPA